jgi:hypothetical protein
MTAKPIDLKRIQQARAKLGLKPLVIPCEPIAPKSVTIKRKVSAPKIVPDESYRDDNYKPLGFINKPSLKAFSFPLMAGLALGGIATAVYGPGLLVMILVGAAGIVGAVMSSKID